MFSRLQPVEAPRFIAPESRPAMRRGDFSCLADALDYAAKSSSGMHFYDARGHSTHAFSYNDICLRAREMASRLMSLGLPRGERVGIVADMHPDFVCLFFACQYAGLLAVPLPAITALGGRQGYEGQLARIIETSRVKVAFGSESSLAFVEAAAKDRPMVMIGTAQDLCRLTPSCRRLAPWGAGEVSHIQFSSGSTQHPKGIIISQDALMANVQAILTDGLEATAEDRVASWLPFYHDMGLIGCMIAPVAGQMHVDYLHTDDFAKRPLQWLQLISDRRSTISFSPTFGYDICADRMQGKTLDLDLSCWRVAGVGGEMVKPETLSKFAEKFAPFHFEAEALMPCYGMAEATLAVTFSPMGGGMRVDYIDKLHLQRGLAAPTPPSDQSRGFASCGITLGDNRLEIRGEAGEALPERSTGQVFIHGSCLMDGYDGEANETAEAIDAEGWLDTGDIGYLADGHLYLTGRAKDMIIINGRNIWPQDLEWAAEHHVKGVKRRDTAAFEIEDGSKEAVILVQCRSQNTEIRAALKQEVHALLQRHNGVNCRVVLIPPRSLPFTTSGKLSRARARQFYLEGAYRDTVLEGAA